MSTTVGCLDALRGNAVCALAAPCALADDRDACVPQIEFARECAQGGFAHARHADQRAIELRERLVKEQNKYTAIVKKMGARAD